jgi:hypothetical protein
MNYIVKFWITGVYASDILATEFKECRGTIDGVKEFADNFEPLCGKVKAYQIYSQHSEIVRPQ